MKKHEHESVLIHLPTFNERDNLIPLVCAIRQTVADADILIIDDSSPDGTGLVADQLEHNDRRVRVLHRQSKQGLGTAILAAMEFARERGYSFLITMDADFSHNPRHLPDMLAMAPSCDVVIGSRYVAQGRATNWPRRRRILSYVVNQTVHFLTRMPVKDSSSGFRCYRVAKLGPQVLRGLVSHGYSFEQEVLLRCFRAGCRFVEIPIDFHHRRAGASKVGPREMLRSMNGLLRLCLAGGRVH